MIRQNDSNMETSKLVSNRVLGLLLAATILLSAGQATEAKSSQHKKSHKQTELEALTSADGEGNAADTAGGIADGLRIAKKEKDSKSDSKNKDKEAPDKDTKSDKDAKSEKKDDGKKDKEAKADKKEKDAKADKKDDKEKKDAKAEKGDEKKSGGFSLFGSKKKEDEKAEADKKGDKSGKPAVAEDPNAPKYKFDPALISVLKDINKNLKESEAVTKLEDATQKLVAKLSADVLEKALSAPDLHANRIVAAKDKESMTNSMSAEGWESGVIEVNPELKASVTALWAKRVDGLLTIQIVGNYDGKVEGATEKLGEFIVVISARSSVDKGFDIQSQQDVSFWIGKVADLKIDCKQGKDAPKPEAQSLLQLYLPITERKRLFLVAAKDYKDKLAKAEEDKKKQAEDAAALAAQQKQVAEALAKTVAEALVKAGKKPGTDALAAAAADATGGNAGEKKAEGSSELTPANSQQSPEVPGQNPAGQNQNATQTPAATATPAQTSTPTPAPAQINPPTPAPASSSSQSKPSSIAALLPDTGRNSRSNWESPGSPSSLRAPSAGANLLFPGRAVAGQYITVAVVNHQHVGEQYVGLNFNGAQLATAENGRVVYQIPEDAPPGYSMHVALSGRPEEAPGAIEILQPLATPGSQSLPNLESVSPVCASGGNITISGHNFDGIAERNRVIIDGAYDANVMVSSPVQMKAQLPTGLSAGQHTLCVSTAGLRSNPISFDLVTVDLNPVGPDSASLKKLTVKVQGTQNRVRVKLINQSRDIIKMQKGDEIVVVTPGGPKNEVVVPVQRLRSGNYNIETEILI